jgi:hypothetical protein
MTNSMRQSGILGLLLVLLATTQLTFGQQTKQQQLEAQKKTTARRNQANQQFIV